MIAPHEMDAMGAWSDEGVAWLPRAWYPKQSDARTFYSKHTSAPWIEVSALARYARHAPEDPAAREFGGEYWVECGKDEPGAFPVWRCE